MFFFSSFYSSIHFNFNHPYSVTPNSKVIFSAGRIKQEKGMQFTIKSMPNVLTKYPNTKFVIAGDGDYIENLKKLTKQLDLDDAVIFLGELTYSELEYYYEIADIFVNATLRETGFDLTIAQAMGHSLPILVTNYNGIEGVVLDKENGLLHRRGVRR